jgi:putative aldouronate transport system permease protein
MSVKQKQVAGELTTMKKKKKKLSSSDLQLYSLCIIPVLLVFIFNYIPMGGIIIAFKNYKFNLGIFKSPWVGFSNFEFFFKSNVFVQLIRNTLFNNFLFIVFGIAASLIVAILLFELKSRTATKIYQTLMITPHFMSWVIVAYMVYAILNPNYGYLNQLLGLFGIENIDWYSKPNAWPVILTITTIWKGVGMDSVVYYASLMGIDTSLFEAAEVDGANKFQRTIHIVLPSLVPLITILTILKIGGIFRADFGLFYTVTQDGASGNLYETTNVIDTYIFRTFKDNAMGNSYGLTAAVSLLQSVVGMILVIVTNWASGKIDKDLGLF